MKLNKKAFLKALEVAVSVAKNRSTMPILSFLRLEGCDGTLKIHATDLDSHVVSQCECEGSLIPICAPANLLHGLAKSAGESIEISMEKDRLRFETNIAGRPSTARLSTLPAADMPPFPELNGENIGLSCPDLAEGIESVAWSCGKELIRVNLSNVFVNIEPKRITCGASNGKQGAYFSRPMISAAAQFIIPAIHAILISDALKLKGAVLHITPNQVVVISDTLNVSAKRADCQFVEISKLLAGERKPCGDIELAALRKALESCQTVGADSQRFAKVYLLPCRGRVRVQCQSETNTYLTWLDFPMPERVNVDAAMFLESLSKFGDRVKMELGNESRLIVMESGDLSVVTGTCIKDKDVDDPEYDSVIAAEKLNMDVPPLPNDDPPPMEVVNPDDYKDTVVNF